MQLRVEASLLQLMTAASTRTLDTLRRHFGAREAGDFFGRGHELGLLQEAAAQAANGIARLIAVTGPGGSGRRELLRQAAIASWTAESPVLPVCIESDELSPAAIWPAVLS